MKQRSRILASLTAFFVVLAGSTLAVVAPASAHHGTITSSVVCQAGKAKVTWNIKNSEDHVAEVTATTGTTGLPVGTQIPVKGSAGFTWTQMIDLGARADISVSLRWPKNNATNTAIGSASAESLDCDTPVTPVKPELTLPVCGDLATVILPQTTGVFYEKTVLGNGNVKVTASPTAGYKFPASVTTEWTFEIPPVVPCDVTVNPVAPTLSTPECGYEAVVQLTAVTGVTYSQTRAGNVVTVTATPKAGYSFANGTVASWELTIPETAVCNEPAIPVAPTLSTPVCDEEAVVKFSETTGVSYTQTRDGGTIFVTATADEGYFFVEGTVTSWELMVPEVVPCVEAFPVAPALAPPVCGVETGVMLEDVEGVTYLQTLAGDEATVVAIAEEGFYFDEDVVTSWVLIIPAVEPCVEATPVAPTLSTPVCDEEAVVQFSETTGVSYTQSRDGDMVYVTATADEGYYFEEETVTSWELLIPEIEPCVEATPVVPTLSTPECGAEAEVMLTDAEGVSYSQTRDGDMVYVTATAGEGYFFAEDAVTTWELVIPEVVPCDVLATPIAPALAPPVCGVETGVMLEDVEGVTYLQTLAGDVATVTAIAEEGFYFAEDAVTSWELLMPEVAPCDVLATPVAPALSSPMCGAEAQVKMPPVKGVAYTQVSDGAMVTVTATANDGYVFTENAVTSWTVNMPAKKVCAVVPLVTQPPTYVYNTAWLAQTGAGDVALTGALALLVTAAGVILVRRRSVNA